MKEYDVLVEMKHNGKNLKAGDSLTLEDKEAEPLMKLKVVSEKTMKLSELEELTGTPNKTPEPEGSGKTDTGNNENTNATENGSPESGNENGSAEETSGTENNEDKKGKAGKK